MLKWGIILGLIGFVVPMIVTRDASWGWAFGLFITGPLCFILGLVVGLVRSYLVQKDRVLPNTPFGDDR